MDISVKTISYPVEDRAWLGSAHGTDCTESITVATSEFTRTTHYPNGAIPSGMPVALITSGDKAGLYGPYGPTETNGQQHLAGHLFSSIRVPDNGANVGAALLWHGAIVIARLPAGHGLGPAGIAAAPGSLRYR
ncbi:head decoration protein [Actinoplanes sp. NPDC049118]|uniref:head decoration protein n=1 Tax=Actinoplanes sp. NPDC049118 TaxID=3155769 RepID=UPI0033DE2533